MSYDFAPLVLYSKDRTRMLNFLSDVFEFEVNEADFSVRHQNLSLKVEPNEDLAYSIPKTPDHRVVFTFRISNQEEFDEIINKFNFFQYRRGINAEGENISTGENANANYIIIRDIDARPWKFELLKKVNFE